VIEPGRVPLTCLPDFFYNGVFKHSSCLHQFFRGADYGTDIVLPFEETLNLPA
jgi:hypothetical protein